MRVVFLESYYGGSHAHFADALVKHSRHRFTLVTMPARKWKWRMRGSALWFARDACSWVAEDPHVILCSDITAVADLGALLPSRLQRVPIVCFFHENQLTYPMLNESERDYQYGFTNISSCLAAQEVWFNSGFHRQAFLQAATKLLARMPDYVPAGVVSQIESRSRVLYPPVEVDVAVSEGMLKRHTAPPTILWCHRWEYDKNPELFFSTLIRLHDDGFEFRLVLTGQQFRNIPLAFEAIHCLGEHVCHAGFVADKAAYLRRIADCDLVVSTAIGENFGIAVVEAMACGCQPLLPNRLAYPEVLPPQHHDSCLYGPDSQLFDHLANALSGSTRMTLAQRLSLAKHQRERFGAAATVSALDAALDEVVARHS